MKGIVYTKFGVLSNFPFFGLFQPLSPSELIQVVGKYSESQEGSSDNDDSDDDVDDDDDDKDQLSDDSRSEGDVEREMPSDSPSSLSQSQSSIGTESVLPENKVFTDSEKAHAFISFNFNKAD